MTWPNNSMSQVISLGSCWVNGFKSNFAKSSFDGRGREGSRREGYWECLINLIPFKPFNFNFPNVGNLGWGILFILKIIKLLILPMWCQFISIILKLEKVYGHNKNSKHLCTNLVLSCGEFGCNFILYYFILTYVGLTP